MKQKELENLRYKVVKLPDLTSTGLLHSTILTYKKKRWTYPAEPPQNGKHGPGGCWANRTISQARHLQVYLRERYRMRTAIFLCLIDRVLFESSYRTKTNRLFLIDRIA